MAICQKCHQEIAEGTPFCGHCGTRVAAENPADTKGKLHCPSCKSRNFTITTESSVTGGVTTHHGGFSSTHMSNSHANYWICSDCGTKFRNIQNLEEEIAKSKNTPKVFAVLAVIAVVLAVYLLSKTSDMLGFLMVPYAIGAGVAALVFFILALSCRGKLKKMRTELQYLKEKCFD